MKKRFYVISVILSLFFIFSFNLNNKSAYADTNIYLGGMPAGFTLNTKGAEIVGITDIITDNGVMSPAKDAGLSIGDIILKIDDNDVNGVIDIENSIKTNTVIAKISRKGEILYKSISPVKDISNNYRLGVLIRDGVSGIGTITFIKGNRIAALGHPVLNDDKSLIEITGGCVYPCNITGYVKGERGKAGELRGNFLRSNSFASIEKNLFCGVYGHINDGFEMKNLEKIEIGSATPGNADIYSTITGNQAKKYSISIIKVDNNESCKNFVIKVTDKELLNTTGGIVQGMSGSPIVQNGKLVGAVTHVFINDPTKGFGISINKMLNN